MATANGGETFKRYLGGIYKLMLNKSTSTHYAIIQSIYDLFVMAKGDIDLMRAELCIKTAHGIWLDYWGEFFGVYRKNEEGDFEYSRRIIASIIQPKSTIPAIKDNIVTYLNTTYKKQYTREDINIYEPWVDVGKYSHNAVLSNSARFFSQDYWTHAVMVISVPEDITGELIDLVNAVKAAGVKVIWSILNSYDIISGFNDANEAWASYQRWIQTQVHRNYFGGLTLSQSSPRPKLSGSREIWREITSYYQWYAKVNNKNTDDSIIITKYDLMGLLDFYEKVEVINERDYIDNFIVSDNGELSGDKLMSGSTMKQRFIMEYVAITNEMIETLQMLDDFLTLSYHGRLSVSDGTMFQMEARNIEGKDIFDAIMNQLDKFKKFNRNYYDHLQGPITVSGGSPVQFLVPTDKNWLWNTPTMTHEDLFKLWEPVEEYEEHTINSIVEFEDAYYNGYITFGDKYQPPIVTDNHRFLFTTRTIRPWLFYSPLYQNQEIEPVLQRQFDYGDKWIIPEPTIEEIEALEEYNFENYSVARETQSPIVVNSRPNVRCHAIHAALSTVKFDDLDVIGHSKYENRVDYTLEPLNTNEYVRFESSDTNILEVDDDGFLTFKGIGSAVITITCGVVSVLVRYMVVETVEEQQPIPPIEPDPVYPEKPLKNVHTWLYMPNGDKFISFDDLFDIDNQTIFMNIELDNTKRNMQNVFDIGTELDGVVHNMTLSFPKLANQFRNVNIIDTKDNFYMSGAPWGMHNEQPEYRIEHIEEDIQVPDIDTADNLSLSRAEQLLSTSAGILSGSEFSMRTEHITRDITIVDEPDGFIINGQLSGGNLLSGSRYRTEKQYSRHDYDESVIYEADTSDNFRLSGKEVYKHKREYVYTDKKSHKLSVNQMDNGVKLSGDLQYEEVIIDEKIYDGSKLSGVALMSGSEMNKKIVDTIYNDVKDAQITIANNPCTENLNTNTLKVAINALGYYINGVPFDILDTELEDVIQAIRQSGKLYIKSNGNNESYAYYKEISTYNHLLSEYEMGALTS